VPDLRVLEAQYPFELRVHVDVVRLQVPIPYASRGCRGRQGIALLMLAERVLEFLPIGDIDARADVPGKSAVPCIPRHAVIEEPTVDAVGSAKAVFHAEWLTCVE